eukprot:14419820-Alexandrium_andersonii.AAC.1
MSASLVGSEMCIRDRWRLAGARSGPGKGADHWARGELKALPVEVFGPLARLLEKAERMGAFPE